MPISWSKTNGPAEYAIKTYKTPLAFETALKQYARDIVRNQKSGTVDAVMRGFYFQRLTARVFQSDPDGWLLKGGQALLVRYPAAARLSKDIDLQRLTNDSSMNEALDALLNAASLDLNDFLRYIPGRIDRHGNENGGVKQSFQVLIGNRKVDTIHVDLVARRNITATPQSAQLYPRPDLPWPTDWPTIKLYPLVDHLADKICAMHEWHGTVPSGRFRDLADILLISQNEALDAAATHHALHTEASLRRASNGPELRLPDRFVTPHDGWPAGYRRAAADVAGLQSCDTWDTALPAAEAFLAPLLGPAFTGTWCPEQGTWSPG